MNCRRKAVAAATALQGGLGRRVGRQLLASTPNEVFGCGHRPRSATTFGPSPAMLRIWENADREPRSAARILLTIISREPEAALRAIRSGIVLLACMRGHSTRILAP